MFIALGLGLILAIGITHMFYAYGKTTNQTEEDKEEAWEAVTATPEYKTKKEAWWNVEGTDKAYEKAWEDLKEADTAVRATREGKALKVLQEAFKVYDEAEKAKDEAREALKEAEKVRDKAWMAVKATLAYKVYWEAKKTLCATPAWEAYEEAEDAYDGVWWGWEIND